MKNSKSEKKFFKRLTEHPFVLVVFIVFVIYLTSLFFVAILGVLNSLKELGDIYTNRFGLPKIWKFDNYAEAFTNLYVDILPYRYYLPQLFFNSLIYSVGTVAISTCSTCACAYLFNKYRCKFGDFLYGVYLVLMIIPIVGNVGSGLAFAQAIGTYDNLLFQLFTGITFTSNPLIFYAAWSGVSKDYMEAAFIDGAGHWRTMITVMWPMISVIFTIQCITRFIPTWNDYMTPMTYLPSFPTAAYALFRFNGDNYFSGQIPLRMAAAMLLCVPCILLFLVFKKKMLGNMSLGGIKG